MNLFYINLIAIGLVFILAVGSSIISYLTRDRSESATRWWVGLINDLRGELWGAVLTGIIFTFIVTTAEQVQEQQRLIDDLVRAAGSSVNAQAVRAVEELQELDLLAGEHGVLQGANLDGANLRGVDLEGANLSGVSFVMADLTDANLFGSNLEEVNFESANLTGTILAGANMRHAYVSYDISNSIFVWSSHTGTGAIPPPPPTFFNEETILPDAVDAIGATPPVYNKRWTPDTDMSRYTDPDHPDFWQPEWAK